MQRGGYISVALVPLQTAVWKQVLGTVVRSLRVLLVAPTRTANTRRLNMKRPSRGRQMCRKRAPEDMALRMNMIPNVAAYVKAFMRCDMHVRSRRQFRRC